MRLLLTSFGIEQRLAQAVREDTQQAEFDADIPHWDLRHAYELMRQFVEKHPHAVTPLVAGGGLRLRAGHDSYHQAAIPLYAFMPPVDMRAIRERFVPDYAAMLLAEKLIMDRDSFAVLNENPHPLYRNVADAFQRLHQGGFIELVDFVDILKTKRSLLEKMTELDLRTLDEWATPLRDSLNHWRGFSSIVEPLLQTSGSSNSASTASELVNQLQGDVVAQIPGQHDHTGIKFEEALTSVRKRRLKAFRGPLRETLRSYLQYVNANLVLANELNVGFHDWEDFLPFYQRKFMGVGKESVESEQQIEALRRLFQVPFPEFAIQDNTQFMRAVEDPRIDDLRKMIANAVKGAVEFDAEFAKRTLTEVLKVESTAKKWCTITSYVSMPLDFIPWVGSVLQRVVEEAAGSFIDFSVKTDYRWYYMLSSVSEQPTTGRALSE